MNSRNRLVNAEDETSAPFLKEDQDNINAFARLNQQRAAAIRQRQLLQKEKEELEDAGNEVMLQTDDDGVKIKIGDCFFPTTNSDAEEYVAKATTATDKELAEVEAKINEDTDKMDKLKATLYAKFGKTINLDAD